MARAVIEGSANVFADLQVRDSGAALARADLAVSISEIIRERRLTQAEAAEILAVDQPKVSALMRGRLTGFSTDRLLRFLLLLGRDVSITIRPKRPGRTARMRVLAA